MIRQELTWFDVEESKVFSVGSRHCFRRSGCFSGGVSRTRVYKGRHHLVYQRHVWRLAATQTILAEGKQRELK